jgi:hypothetical protein
MLIELPKELEILKEVNVIQIENLKNEVNSFCSRVKKLNRQLKDLDDSQLNNLKNFIDVYIYSFLLLFAEILRFQ